MYRYLQYLLSALVLAPGVTFGDELMGSQSQWTVTYVSNRGEYCNLAWDSGMGRKVEFQAGRDTIAWLVSNDAWKLAGSGGGEVDVVGRYRNWKFNGKAQSATSLLLSDNTDSAASIRAILTKAVRGGPDIQLKFPGTEPDWTVPISRLFPIHATVEKCMSRLRSTPISKPDQETTSPF
ncbi:hypothetical protein [Rhizobium sp. BK376]|uniref:hypothetical protein n=1 Tax=Rhizobium sp. BK376 TaxID=2512149 RepID=UPI00104843F3|nr:hypothetical protein [Rhizobium sp. BK376]TCR85300.1 hypothetical protein EV561_10771 [Rhizobium sp. BK376]